MARHDAVARARLEAEIPERADVSLIQYSARASADGPVLRSTIKSTLQEALIPRMELMPPEAALLLQWQQLSEDPVWAVMPYHLEIH